MRKLLMALSVLLLPLTAGIAWGGLQLASATGTPTTLGCSQVATTTTFQNTGGPIADLVWSNAADGGVFHATAASPVGSTQITMNVPTGVPLFPGQVVTIGTGSYEVVLPNGVEAGPLSAIVGSGEDTEVDITPALAKSVIVGSKVVVAPTDNSADTTAYSVGNVNVSAVGQSCAPAVAQDFYPNTIDLAGTIAASDSGTSVEFPPASASLSLSYPGSSSYKTGDDPDYSVAPLSPLPTLTWKSGLTIVLSLFGFQFTNGVLTTAAGYSDPYATKAASLKISYDGAILCTEDQVESIEASAGALTPFTDCDGAPGSSVTPAQAYGELLAPTLSQVVPVPPPTGSDGSLIVAIAQLDGTGSATI